jgi:uncharacterized protein
MKRTLLPILCCPACKGDLVLTVAVEDEKEIVRGTLHCASCNVDCPIDEGIPDLLPRTSDK